MRSRMMELICLVHWNIRNQGTSYLPNNSSNSLKTSSQSGSGSNISAIRFISDGGWGISKYIFTIKETNFIGAKRELRNGFLRQIWEKLTIVRIFNPTLMVFGVGWFGLWKPFADYFKSCHWHFSGFQRTGSTYN